MRVVALIASYNEQRHIAMCLEHLFAQGVEVYLLDNDSTDRTVEIAESYRGSGLIGLENLPRDEDSFSLHRQMKEKERLAGSIDADWFIHQDVDEIRHAHRPGLTLKEAFEEVDAEGYNAVNFLELTFVPTREEPNHDHPDFLKTIRSYYPFMRRYPNQIKAWKHQPEGVELAKGGGHKVRFENQLLYPEPFVMRHYPYLSVDHFATKYVGRRYVGSELKQGWHGWRARLSREKITLPSSSELNTYTPGDENRETYFDFGKPRFNHIAQSWTETPSVAKQKESPVEIPIIVGGCFRSGTSLVRRILGSHSRIYCGPEVKFFRDFHNDYIGDPIKHGRFVESAQKILPEEVLMDELGGSFVRLQREAARRAHKPRWADKNPENVIHLKDWERLLGDNFVFVHIVRNPLDTLASIKEIGFPKVVPADLDARIALYNRYMRGGLDFEAKHPERYRRVFYEELTSDPEGVVLSLMEWLGEDFEPGQLDFNSKDHQSGLEDPKVSKTTEVHAASVGKWREILTEEEVQKIRAGCGPFWERISTPKPEHTSLRARLSGKVRKFLSDGNST